MLWFGNETVILHDWNGRRLVLAHVDVKARSEGSLLCETVMACV